KPPSDGCAQRLECLHTLKRGFVMAGFRRNCSTSRRVIVIGVISSLATLVVAGGAGAQPGDRFQGDYSKTAAKHLLPAAPQLTVKPWSLGLADLGQVPQVGFWDTPGAAEPIAQMNAKINQVNRQKADRFMQLLIDNRPDLAGLPFVLGDACRTKK